MEIWKDVVGYEGIYEVSNTGLVRTHINKTTFTERHGIRKWNQRIMKQKTDKGGYKRIELWLHKSHKTWLVHHLVGYAFLDKKPNDTMINHKDLNPSNNCVENLEWCDSLYNVRHAFANGVMYQIRCKLVDIETNEEFNFMSLSQASRFLDRVEGYVTYNRKNNIFKSKNGKKYKLL